MPKFRLEREGKPPLESDNVVYIHGAYEVALIKGLNVTIYQDDVEITRDELKEIYMEVTRE